MITPRPDGTSSDCGHRGRQSTGRREPSCDRHDRQSTTLASLTGAYCIQAFSLNIEPSTTSPPTEHLLHLLRNTTRHPQVDIMAADQRDIYDSMTMQSDSETYDQPDISSPSSPSSDSASPLILYSPPTFWGLARGAAINLLLPFVNGLMLGFGELFANELAFRFGWSNTKVRYGKEVFNHKILTGVDLPLAQTSRTWSRDANRPYREEKTQWTRDGRLHELGIRMEMTTFNHVRLDFALQHGEESALMVFSSLLSFSVFSTSSFLRRSMSIYHNHHTLLYLFRIPI